MLQSTFRSSVSSSSSLFQLHRRYYRNRPPCVQLLPPPPPRRQRSLIKASGCYCSAAITGSGTIRSMTTTVTQPLRNHHRHHHHRSKTMARGSKSATKPPSVQQQQPQLPHALSLSSSTETSSTACMGEHNDDDIAVAVETSSVVMYDTISNDSSSTATNSALLGTRPSSSISPPPPTQPPTIYILGAGSIGLLFASMIRCTYPSYPIRLLLHSKSSLLPLLSSSSSSTKKIIPVCLQQMFCVPTPATKTTKFRRRTASSRSPRMVPVPYEIIANEDDVDNGKVHDRPRVSTPFRADSYIFVTTKAYQALDAIRSIRDRLFVTRDHPEATNTTTTTSPVNIVVCCNGALAVVERIQDYFQNELQGRPTMQPPRIYYGIITHGAYRNKELPPRTPQISALEPGRTDEHDDTVCHVIHAGNGSITILPLRDDTNRMERDSSVSSSHNPPTIDVIVDVLETSGLNCILPTTDETLLLLWKKLAVNCIINPLTVIYHCHNGALLSSEQDNPDDNAAVVPNFKTQYLDPICHEIAQVYVVANATVTDVSTDCSSSNTATITTKTTNRNETERVATIMRDYVIQVIRDTALNRSSTYQDVYMSSSASSNKNDSNHHPNQTAPLTEMDYFNGYIIAKSQQYQLECPVNKRVIKEFYSTINQRYR